MEARKDRLGKRRRLFCKLIVNDDFEDINVYLKRYICKDCSSVYLSKGPFYPNVVYGAPIVDFVLYFAARNPYNRTERIMMSMGIQVDRDTIKRWVKLFEKKVSQLAGIRIFDEPIAINLLKILYNAKDIEELKRRVPKAVLNAI